MNKKYVMLVGVLMLGLTLSGITYAHWLKIVTVYGEVETGYLHLTPKLQMDIGYIPGQINNKDVAEIVWVDRCGLADNQVGFRIERVYPCLDTGKFYFGIINDGTIPAGLEDMRISGTYQHELDGSATVITDEVTYTAPVWDTTEYLDDYWRIDLYWAKDPDPYGPNEYYSQGCPATPMASIFYRKDTNQWYDPGMSNDHGWLQIDTGGEVWIEVRMHFWECLPQRTEFTFTVEFEYWNWNEAYPYFNPI